MVKMDTRDIFYLHGVGLEFALTTYSWGKKNTQHSHLGIVGAVLFIF